MMKIYHNPRCGKSRQTLALIQDAGMEVEVIHYLKTPLDEKELKEVLGKLGIQPEDLIRKGEAIFKEKYKGKTLTNQEWVQAIVEYPILMERPIVVKGDRAVIGRPPENVKALF